MRRRFLAVLIVSFIGSSHISGNLQDKKISPEEPYLSALKLVGQGQYREALKALQDILKTNPTFSRGVRKISEVSQYMGETDLPKAIFEQLLQENKTNAAALYGLGIYFSDKKDFGKALENVKNAIALFSASPFFYHIFINSSEQLKQLDSAEAALLSIAKNEPGNFAPLYGLAYLRRKQGNRDGALDYLEKAIRLNPDDLLVYRLKSDVLEDKSQYKDMLALCLDKVNLCKNFDPDLEIDFCTRISSAYGHLGQYQNEFEYDLRGLEIAREIGNKKSEGIILGNVGVHYANTGNIPEAIKYLNQKLAVTRELRDKGEEAQVLSNLGALCDWQGNVQKALENYQQALKLLDELDNKPQLAVLMGNMGAAYEKLSEYPKSLDYYHQALKIFQDTKNRGNEAWILGNLGATAAKLGNDQEALGYFEKALAIMQEVGDRKYEGWVLGTMGAIYNEQGDKEKALQFLNRALEIAREIGDKSMAAEHLANTGSIYQQAGEYEKSAEYLGEALKIAEELGDKVATSEALIILGILHRDLKDNDRSIDDFARALQIGNELGVLRTVWNSEWGLGISYLANDQYDQALKHYQNAVATVESIRARLVREEQKMGFLGETRKVYEGFIELLFILKEKEVRPEAIAEAFHVAERAKSRAFLELMAEAKVDLTAAISPELENEEKDLQVQLNGIQQQLLDPELKDKENLYKELQTVETRYSDFIVELRKKNPQYASAVYPEPYTLAEVQVRLLDEKSYILEFFMGEEQLYSWVVSKDRILSWRSLPYDQKLLDKISDYQTQIAQRKINLDFRLGKEIYDILLKGALEKVPASSRLIIIPDGLLLRFPFEALVKKYDGKTPRYLLEDYTVCYGPSASVLGEVARSQKAAIGRPLDLLALGNPVIEEKGDRAQAAAEILSTRGIQLLPLPYAEEEVSSISQIYKGKGKSAESFVKEKALEEVIKSAKTGQYKTLHLATHGFVDDRVPALSGLLLAPSEAPGGDDGFLRLNEIFHLKLNTDLVTLSACETALGKEVRGEGMIGLTRAFFYAGTRSIIASLWMVSDQSTALLMKDFYSHYIKGEQASTALRQAKLSLLKGKNPLYRHPFFWAPFVIMGSSQSTI